MSSDRDRTVKVEHADRNVWIEKGHDAEGEPIFAMRVVPSARHMVGNVLSRGEHYEVYSAWLAIVDEWHVQYGVFDRHKHPIGIDVTRTWREIVRAFQDAGWLVLAAEIEAFCAEAGAGCPGNTRPSGAGGPASGEITFA